MGTQLHVAPSNSNARATYFRTARARNGSPNGANVAEWILPALALRRIAQRQVFALEDLEQKPQRR